MKELKKPKICNKLSAVLYLSETNQTTSKSSIKNTGKTNSALNSCGKKTNAKSTCGKKSNTNKACN